MGGEVGAHSHHPVAQFMTVVLQVAIRVGKHYCPQLITGRNSRKMNLWGLSSLRMTGHVIYIVGHVMPVITNLYCTHLCGCDDVAMVNDSTILVGHPNTAMRKKQEAIHILIDVVVNPRSLQSGSGTTLRLTATYLLQGN